MPTALYACKVKRKLVVVRQTLFNKRAKTKTLYTLVKYKTCQHFTFLSTGPNSSTYWPFKRQGESDDRRMSWKRGRYCQAVADI